jgi:hypothetical protein
VFDRDILCLERAACRCKLAIAAFVCNHPHDLLSRSSIIYTFIQKMVKENACVTLRLLNSHTQDFFTVDHFFIKKTVPLWIHLPNC